MRGILTIVVAASLVALPLSGATGWVEERELAPYLIRSEFALRDVAELVSDLGDLQADVERLLKLKCEPREIQIHLFRSRSSYNDYLSKRVPDGTKRQALFVQGTDAGRVYAYRQAYRQRDLDTDVRHETTHALLHTALPYVPIWLDEGIAEYFEASPGLREKHHPHRGELQRAIRFFGWKPGIEKLEAEREMLGMNDKDYRDAWGVIHFILHGPPAAREALAAYFEEVQSGKAPTPLSQHLRRRIPNLDREIVEHLK
ncbi:MAG: hypothetical protein AABP62_06655 [Planctomycetota bacterium]